MAFCVRHRKQLMGKSGPSVVCLLPEHMFFLLFGGILSLLLLGTGE